MTPFDPSDFTPEFVEALIGLGIVAVDGSTGDLYIETKYVKKQKQS